MFGVYFRVFSCLGVFWSIVEIIEHFGDYRAFWILKMKKFVAVQRRQKRDIEGMLIDTILSVNRHLRETDQIYF